MAADAELDGGMDAAPVEALGRVDRGRLLTRQVLLRRATDHRLGVAARLGATVDGRDHDAVGVLEKNAAGKLAITRVTLRPKIQWSPGVTVSPEVLAQLHHDAHENCFIASSVKTEVTVAPQD